MNPDPSRTPEVARTPGTRLLRAGVIAFALVAVVGWLVFNAVNGGLNDVDLTVYRDGGLIVRHVGPYYDPKDWAPLYGWGGYSALALKFTYTPFAAIAFAVVSFLPWGALQAASVAGNMAALVAALWFTFGGLGYRDRRVRLGATLVAAAVTFWLQPVIRTIYLGQVNLVLMAMIMWDLCQPGTRADGRACWWKGALTGVAAGIKLVPLVFVPYLLITRRFREAVATVAGFVVTVAVGFAVLPHDSSQWWLHGMFLADGNRTGFMGWAGNQSLRAIITRFAGLGRRRPGPVDRRGGDRPGARDDRRVPARPGRLPGAGAARDRAHRPARLPGELGPPLGLDRPRDRGDRALRARRDPAGARPDERGQPWPGRTPDRAARRAAAPRPARRPLALAARRVHGRRLRRVAGRAVGERAHPRQPVARLPLGTAQHQPGAVRHSAATSHRTSSTTGTASSCSGATRTCWPASPCWWSRW